MIGLGRWTCAVAALSAVVLHTQSAEAHFYLQAPPADMQQDGSGNPQKDPPCGGAGTATGIITPFQAGTTITITIDEKIFHPGHYRVVLAENDMSELPADPPITPVGNDACGSTEIQNPPVYPVLADGMLQHTAMFNGPQSFDVTLPSDVTCDNCVLQVIEYMSNHGAPCFYHHCATIALQQDPVMTTSSSATGASSGAGGSGNGSGGADTTSGNGGTGAGLNLLGADDEGDCSCTVVGEPSQRFGSLAMLAFVGAGMLAGARRRR